MKLLFETVLSGHRMEYIHHIYMGMTMHPNEKYVIVVPEEFKEKSNNYEWPDRCHIIFDYISSDVAKRTNVGSMLFQSWKKVILLRKYIKKYRPQKTFLITLISYIPFLPLLISSRYKIVAILYKIYLYEWKDYPARRRFLEILKFKIIVWGGCIKTVLILNDRSAVACYKRVYHSDKFCYLTDPYNEIDYSPQNVRSALTIPENNIVYLHFGGLQKRKGTLEILKAIEQLPEEDLKAKTFVFAGKVYDDIRLDFYKLKERVEKKCQILVYDEYCSKEFLADICWSCDIILIPYQVTAQSSGLLGYAAHYGKPVIGPSSGLIGKLIRKYQLGYMVHDVSSFYIAKAIHNFNFKLCKTEYRDMIQVSEFLSQIFSAF